MSAPKQIEIPAFPGGKRIAVTTSWDDGVVYDRWVVAALNELGMKGTFNLCSGLFQHTDTLPTDESGEHIAASEVPTLYQGHEVAVHTCTHPNLLRLDATQIALEVINDRQALEDLVGYPVRGMAYPGGAYNAQVIEILRSLGIVYCRTIGAECTSFPPAEPLAWASTMHILATHPTPLPERWEKCYQNKRFQGVFYVWGHSYEFDKDRQRLHELLAPLANKPDVWYCTNIELYDYEAARQRLIIAANRRTCYNPSAQPVTIIVDGNLVEVPAGLVKI